MINTNLTEGELKVAMILVKSCLNGMGGERPADLESDEYTWIDLGDIRSEGYSLAEARGYWSSLTQKGFIDEIDDGEWALAAAAWKFLDTVWEG